MPADSVAPELIVQPTTTVDAAFWMNAAHAAVRRFCGWHVAPVVTTTMWLDGSGQRAMLAPSGHIVDVLGLTVDGVELTPEQYDWSPAGVIELRCGRFTNRLRGVKLHLTHGYTADDVPDVAALIVSLAKRGASTPGAVARQSVNGASVDYLTGGGAPLSIPLLGAEKDLLAPYRLTWEA